MVTNLYFVRHAHSTYSPDEYNRPLSERGKTVALKVTNLLKHENIHILISSPYKRAIQTIEGLTDWIGDEIIIEEDFRERRLSRNPVDDFEFAITKVWEDDAFSWEGGESNMVAQQRGIRAVEKILERYEGKNIVIGTHGNIMVLIMKYFDQRFDFTLWKQLDMPDIYKLSFEKHKFIEGKRIWNRDSF